MNVQTPVSGLIHAGTVRDTAVFSADGERIGHVDDISIDKLTGQVAYAVLAAGGFLGLGEKLHPVPWSILKYDTHLNGYVVPLDKDRLKAAPSYERSELADAGANDTTYRDMVFGYYTPFGATPYWL